MKLDATPDTVRAVAEVLKLASFLDDRIAHADPGRIAAWAEQVQRHQLDESDLLDGVQAFYDSATTHAIGIGDLIFHASMVAASRRREHARTPIQRCGMCDDNGLVTIAAETDTAWETVARCTHNPPEVLDRKRQAEPDQKSRDNTAMQALAAHQARMDRIAANFDPKDPDDAKALAYLPTTNPLRVVCPWCGAQPTQRCYIPGVIPRRYLKHTRAHPKRLELAEQ